MQLRTVHPHDVSRLSHIHFAAFTGRPMHAPGCEATGEQS